jgi:hypothetical protein
MVSHVAVVVVKKEDGALRAEQSRRARQVRRRGQAAREASVYWGSTVYSNRIRVD